MPIIVQKYGGTSLSSAENRNYVLNNVVAAKRQGYQVVVVVSAMGRNGDAYATDTLISLLRTVNHNPPSREMDMLLSCGEVISGVVLTNCLLAEGENAVFLTGAQAGIVTDDQHGDAHILRVKTTRILELLETGNIVVIAGFQGVNEQGELTTLGRGGSDTTAAAIGVALNAEVIDIFTDVDGIMTADPRIVKDARLLTMVTYNELCQLAREGAKVIHPRAVEIAMQRNVPLRVRSTFSDSTGTLVCSGSGNGWQDPGVDIERDHVITGITQTPHISQIKIVLIADDNTAQVQLKVFKAMALANISVDFINVCPELISYTVSRDDADRAREILDTMGIKAQVTPECAKVAVVGAAMTGIPGVMSRVVEALVANEIPILQTGDSYTNIWCLVPASKMEKAVAALHARFSLGLE